ncbi:MAG: antibiotic biosynthesis monooxygenase [Mycobacteriales bacterium]
MTFAPGQVVTVFRSRLAPGHLEEYAGTAARMEELARSMPGYIEHKAFTAEDGERVTLVTFADHASQTAWRTQVEHLAAQRRGREAFYASYTLQVADVTSVSLFGGGAVGGGAVGGGGGI